MSATTQQIDSFEHNNWHDVFSSALQSQAISSLESGKVLYFPSLPFTLLPKEQRFLSPTYASGKSKNISYDQRSNTLRGMNCPAEDYLPLQQLLERFGHYATQFIHGLFPTYQQALIAGRTSYRPIEIAGRISSYRKDDTRLHVDSFPATPNAGKRILRVFSNINPENKPRVWRLGASFEEVAKEFLPQVRFPIWGSAWLLQQLKLTKGRRTHYDHVMLQIHDRMKNDLAYQARVCQQEINFPAGSSWIVQTDQVSHAAMSGQYVLEQTFYLPVSAMANQNFAPLRILERLTGRPLVV